MITIIDTLFQDFSSISSVLITQKEVSFCSTFDNTCKKHMLLAIASFFEHEIKESIFNMAVQTGNEYIANLIRNKALDRQYHTLFDWDKKNANKFFGLFGADFKESAEIDVQNDEKLAQAIKDFLEIGNLRNQLAHLNFAVYPIDKTTEEVYHQYQSASYFIIYLRNKFK